jgi:hypothetical protein
MPLGKMLVFEADIGAGSQFAGSEFRAQARTKGAWLKLKELDLQMGTESKTFRVEKRDGEGNLVILIQQSTDASGAPAANTDESLLLTGPDIEVLLSPSEQIQVVTSGATSAMKAKLYLEEVIPGA